MSMPVIPLLLAAGLIQYDANAHFGDVATNRARLTVLADEAVDRGAGMVVFPEGSTLGYVGEGETWCSAGRDTCGEWRCRDVTPVAESLPGGPTTAYWASYARGRNVHVVYSVIEASGGHFYDSVGVVGPSGFVTGYRKRILYGPDDCYAEPGTSPATFDIGGEKMGLLICADVNSDDFLAAYRASGVAHVVLPMDWDQSPTGDRAAKAVVSEKAQANGVLIDVADLPAWDGTGRYLPEGGPRLRPGLPEDGVGVEGVTVVGP